MAIGGAPQEISIGGRIFPVAADTDVKIDLGGMQLEQQPNGDGSSRKIGTRKLWSLSGLKIQIDHARADLEFLQEKADAMEDVPCTCTMTDSVTYGGKGNIDGEIACSEGSAVAEITLKGPGKLEQQ